MVRKSAAQLDNTNQELDAFAFSISHDLRAPLRHLDGYSQALLEDCYPQLDSTGRNYIERIRSSALHMNEMIDAILNLSRLTRAQLNR